MDKKLAELGNDQKEKRKKEKQEGELSLKKMVQKTGTAWGKVCLKLDASNAMPTCGLEEESIKRKEKKKQKKQKPEIDISLEIVERVPDCEKDNVNEDRNQVKTSKNFPANSSDVTEDSCSHKKRKKAKKSKGEEKEVNVYIKYGMTNDISPSNCDVSEESGSHKKRKKVKKRKHESDLRSDKIEGKAEGKEKGVNTDVKDKISNVMPLGSCDVIEGSGSHKKKKKGKKTKHESDLLFEKIEGKTEDKEKDVNTDVKDKISNVMPLNSCDITEESRSQRKTRNVKKRKYESDLLSENMEETTGGKEKQVKADVKHAISNDMLPSSCDVTAESCSQRKRKKRKKRKHESELLSEKIEGKNEYKEKDVNADVNYAISNVMPPSSCDVTEKSGIHKKEKKGKKTKHERDILSETIEEKTERKEKDVNTDVKDKISNIMPLSSGGVMEESGCHKKTKKVKKMKDESDLLSKKIKGISQCEEKDGDIDKTEVKISKDMSMSSSEVTKELGENVETASDLFTPLLETSQEPTRTNNDAKRTKKRITNNLSGLDSTQKNTATNYVDKKLEFEETNQSSDVSSEPERNEPDGKKIVEDKTNNQWESAEFACVERKEKFLRLMGAFKPSNKQREMSNYSAMAMNKQQQIAFVCSQEKQYFQAQQTGKEKGVGLGYQ